MHPLLKNAATSEAVAAALRGEARGAAPVDTATPRLTRRALLQAGGGLVVFVGGWAPAAGHAASLSNRDEALAPPTGPLVPNPFVRVGADSSVTVVCKHHEMGQGNTTGLASLVADELDADWALVRTEYAPADPQRYGNLAMGGMQGTGGSSAIANSYVQYRQAGATARAMLVQAAASAWGVRASEVRTARSTLTHASGRRATYGEMAEAASRVTLTGNAPLKQPTEFVYIGKDKSTPRVDSAAKCDGSAVYTIDVRLPGLLTAVVAWPPSFGAIVTGFDASAARRVPGVVDVVQIPEGIAVVATGMWPALQGRKALTVQWDESAGRDLDSDRLYAQYRALARAPGGKVFAKPEQPPRAAAKTLSALYEFPFLAHAPMEPMNCVAWLHDGLLETWAGHQFPSFDQMLAAKASGLPPEKVKLHTLVSGGSFGRRANAWSDFTVAAVHVARAIGGRAPVRLQYTREDDNGAGLYRPLMVHDVQVGLDGSGRIASWKHAVVGQSIMSGTPMEAMMKDGIDPTVVEGVAESHYALPMLEGTVQMPKLPVKPLWFRSVGHTHTAFVMETMIDELAQAAGQDPVAFRRPLLEKNDRARGVLDLVVAKAGWGRRTGAGRALGLALHRSFDTDVAQVAEVALVNGKVKVERVVCAVDCGVAVNPDVVRAQMEGCIGFALGALYYGEVALKNGRAVQRNFDTYRSLRLHEMPVVEVHIVPSSGKPTGVGEPGVPPLAPAVCNAIARLTGRRIRKLPLVQSGLVAT